MKKKALIPCVALALAGSLLAGCSTIGSSEATSESATGLAAFDGSLAPADVLADNTDYTVVNDDEWSAADAVEVKLSGAQATSTSGAVTSKNGTVTITAAGVYRLAGDLAGRVVVDAPDDALVVLLLDGARIESSEGPGIEVTGADDVAISLAAGTTNTVADGTAEVENAAGIYAASDLTISGAGALTVTGNVNDGIVSKDDLVFIGGEVSVIAADDGLRGKDSLVVEGGKLSITATGGDGIKSDREDDEQRGYIAILGGSVSVVAGDDGIQAYTDTVITGGTVTVDTEDDGIKAEKILAISGGDASVTRSYEGIEAANIGVSGGNVSVVSSDDGINASGNAATSNTGGLGEEGAPELPGAQADGNSSARQLTPEDSRGFPDSNSDSDRPEPPSGTDGQTPPELPEGAAMPGGSDSSARQLPSEAPMGGNTGGGMGGGMADTGERLEITGGTVTVDAEGDGVDSNGSLLVSGGDLTVYGPTTGGNGALDSNGGITVTGGTIVAFGAGDMEETPGEGSTQGFVMVKGAIGAGDEVELQNAKGETVATATAKKQAGSVVISNGEITDGEEHTLVSGKTEIGRGTAGAEATGMMGGGSGGPGRQSGAEGTGSGAHSTGSTTEGTAKTSS